MVYSRKDKSRCQATIVMSTANYEWLKEMAEAKKISVSECVDRLISSARQNATKSKEI